MSEFQSAYALARHVAHQLPQHDGKSARELYQAFLPDFAKLGTDGSTGATMINQHLRKMEQEGMVISEKGKLRGNPSKWYWIGLTPDVTPQSGQESDEPGHEKEPMSLSDPRTMSEPPSKSDPRESTEPPLPSEPEDSSEPKLPSEHQQDDQWDELARQFAAACREQAAADRSIDGIEHLASKLGVIDKLIQIMSEDVREVLGAIATDLVNIGGIDK